MEKIKYLNVGCGSKYHKAWVNIDMVSNSEDVITANLIKGMPFADNYFDVVYHSQVLEHIPKEKAFDFIKECYRILKPNGIVRVVVPDLENIVDEYKRLLNENLNDSNEFIEANYDWILLEMYDQTVRNYSGGQMAEVLRQPYLINENYIVGRIGFVGRNNRNIDLTGNGFTAKVKKAFSSYFMFQKALRLVGRKINPIIRFQSKATEIGAFRQGGEIHMWMYDKYSLSRLLKKCGFEQISVKNPFESDIPNWSKYELDVKDDLVYDPTSLFIEARKIAPSSAL